MSASSFQRTTRSLGDDLSGFYLWSIIALVALVAWTVWAVRARIQVIESSAEARLEVTRTTHPLSADVDGLVISVRTDLGQEVRAGDLLIEMDSRADRLKLDEERARLQSSEQQATALRAQIEAAQSAQQQDAIVERANYEQVLSRREQTEADARLRKRELEGLEKLRGSKLISDIELLRAETEAVKKNSEAAALGQELRRSHAAEQRVVSDRKAALEALRRDLARLEGDVVTSRAAIGRLEYEVARRSLRAPVDGRVAELVPLQPGAFVKSGDKLGAVLPKGQLQIVARFKPGAALGRVAPGQRAVMRLTGFPWAEYGTLPARVSRVASEVRDSLVRVDLELDEAAMAGRVPLQHGLPGVVEVEVERATPASLLLRAAGQAVAGTPQ
jgi:membrane fusion protein (multidrug efflux system)